LGIPEHGIEDVKILSGNDTLAGIRVTNIRYLDIFMIVEIINWIFSSHKLEGNS